MKILPMNTVSGAYTLPGDKSITHRAVMLNSVAEGTAVIRGALLGEDCLATVECMRALGAVITVDKDVVTVKGVKKLKSKQALYVANSGTTMRLLAGLLAGRGIAVTLDGDASIQKRPMERVCEPLRSMGANIATTDGHAPIVIKPAALHGIDYTMPIASAQVKSAILLAGLTASGTTSVTQNFMTRDHTELFLSAQSANIKIDGNTVRVERSSLKSVDTEIPADISSAAYLIVLATCLKGSSILIKNVGINPTRRTIVDIVNACGGNISLLNTRRLGYEDVADLLVGYSPKLCPFCLQGETIPNVIDEIPVLCVLAAMINGESRIKDAQELKVKESNRIDTTVAALRSLGVNIEGTEDGMVIRGTGVIMGGGNIDAHGDHRIAMSMAIACALSLDGGEVNGEDAVAVSFPGFFETVIPAQNAE